MTCVGEELTEGGGKEAREVWAGAEAVHDGGQGVGRGQGTPGIGARPPKEGGGGGRI